MNKKKKFRYSWNDHLLKEVFGSPTMSRFAGHAERGRDTEEPTPTPTPPEEKEQTTALILRAKGELEKASGPDAVPTALQRIKAALEKIKGLNPLLVLATMGKDKAKDLGTGLAEFMLKKNAAAVETIFETMGVRTQAAAVMDQAVNWQGRNEKEFFAYDFATIGESLVSEENLLEFRGIAAMKKHPTTGADVRMYDDDSGKVLSNAGIVFALSQKDALEAAGDTSALGVVNRILASTETAKPGSTDTDERDWTKVEDSPAATDTPQGSQQQLDFLKRIEQRINLLFGKRFVSQDWQRFVVAQAIVVYWETMISSNPRGIEEAQLPAVKVIGEHTIKYLQGLVSTFNVDAEKKKADQQIALITDPKKDQKQIAGPTQADAQKATPADVDKLRQKFQQGPQESKQYLSEQKQNQRWKQLAGIK